MRNLLRKAAAMILPWPGRHERLAAISAARERRQHEQEQARRAQGIARQIERMAAENHFAEAIARQLFGGSH